MGLRRKLGRDRLDGLCHLSVSEREKPEKLGEVDCDRRRRCCGRPNEDMKLDGDEGVEGVV